MDAVSRGLGDGGRYLPKNMNTRQKYAQLVRHFYSGRLTNHEYELACDSILQDADQAINQIYCQLWTTYCDFREHRMGLKHGMTRDGRRLVARWIMFLKSERPYEYPIHGCLSSIVKWITLGLIRQPDPLTFGDAEYWPYFRRADFETDLAKPRYLAGRRK